MKSWLTAAARPLILAASLVIACGPVPQNGSPPDAGPPAGRVCAAPWDCASDEFCHHTTNCQQGVCKKHTDTPACPDETPPQPVAEVCTCYGETVQLDSCTVKLGGFAHAGACGSRDCIVNGRFYGHNISYEAPDGCNTCRCLDGKLHCSDICYPCKDELRDVSYPAGPSPDGQMLCAPRPQHCYSMEAPPVCGADGRVYSNFCYARLAGVAFTDTPRCAAVDAGK
jgi:hypothetical protein